MCLHYLDAAKLKNIDLSQILWGAIIKHSAGLGCGLRLRPAAGRRPLALSVTLLRVYHAQGAVRQ
jgi:hypothetical protein